MRPTPIVMRRAAGNVKFVASPVRCAFAVLVRTRALQLQLALEQYLVGLGVADEVQE